MASYPIAVVKFSWVDMSRRTVGRWFYVGVTLLVILLNVFSFAPSIIDPSTRTVPLPVTFIDLAHTLVSVTWLLVFLAQVTHTSAWRDFAAWSVR